MRAGWPVAGNSGDPFHIPLTASPYAFRLWSRRERRLGPGLSEAGGVWGGRRGAFGFQNNSMPPVEKSTCFSNLGRNNIGMEWNEHWVGGVEIHPTIPGGHYVTLGKSRGPTLLSFIHSSFIVWLRNQSWAPAIVPAQS